MAWVACLRGWCASVGGVGGVLACVGTVLMWMTWVACLRVGGVLVCVVWLVFLHVWYAKVGDVGGVLTWVGCYYYCYCYY